MTIFNESLYLCERNDGQKTWSTLFLRDDKLDKLLILTFNPSSSQNGTCFSASQSCQNIIDEEPCNGATVNKIACFYDKKNKICRKPNISEYCGSMNVRFCSALSDCFWNTISCVQQHQNSENCYYYYNNFNRICTTLGFAGIFCDYNNGNCYKDIKYSSNVPSKKMNTVTSTRYYLNQESTKAFNHNENCYLINESLCNRIFSCKWENAVCIQFKDQMKEPCMDFIYYLRQECIKDKYNNPCKVVNFLCDSDLDYT
ncbi:hypothetical protein A3Q56_07978, partial [Intoshia linei]